MAVPTWSVGQILTAADVNSWFVPIAVYKVSTESVTSSATLQNDDVLFASVAANAVYKVELGLVYDGATAGDIQLGWTMPAAAAITNVHTVAITTAGAASTDDVTTATAGNPSFGALGTGTNCGYGGVWILTTAGTSGTLQLQWAQNTSSATATRVFAGSYLVLQRIG
jgi:hypothetical protein